MRAYFTAALVCGFVLSAGPALADDSCSQAKGDVVISARTPEVDLYDGPDGKRVMSLEQDKFPPCTPITGRAPNMMLRVDFGTSVYWVPPYMVKYRFAGSLPPVCRNLAMGTTQEKLGSTRGLGEGCPKPGSTGATP